MTTADYVVTKKLSHAAVMKMLQAAVAYAESIGSPMGISVANPHGMVIGSVLMDGAKFWALESSGRKARTAAAMGKPTGDLPVEAATRMALAIEHFSDLRGAIPVIIDGECVGAIAAGGATPVQDEDAARAGAAVVGVS